jgi:hypothetical protein
MSKKLAAIAGIVVILAVAIVLVFLQDSRQTIPRQTIGQDDNGQSDQETSSPTQDATSNLNENNTSMLPKLAFDSNPYP